MLGVNEDAGFYVDGDAQSALLFTDNQLGSNRIDLRFGTQLRLETGNPDRADSCMWIDIEQLTNRCTLGVFIATTVRAVAEQNARRAVVGRPLLLVADGTLADDVGILEQLTPTVVRAPNKRPSAALQQRSLPRLGNARTSRFHGEWIVGRTKRQR
jgi:hypothetical protein